MRVMLVGLALLVWLWAAPAQAQQTIKIGLLATLEGPFAAGGQDGSLAAEVLRALVLQGSGGRVATEDDAL